MDNYEERYRAALSRARELSKTVTGANYEYIFPELVESEDERIRKELIEQVAYIIPNDDEVDGEGDVLPTYQKRIDKYRAWLEKQGFSKEQTNLPCFTFDDVLALQCCMETVKKVQEDKELYKKLNDLHSKVYDACQLEKQGERKSTEDTKKLDADKVIAWLVANVCNFEYYVSLFKQDFKLWNKKN